MFEKGKNMTELPLRQLTLKIADFIIKANCIDADTGFALPFGSEDFVVTDGKPDCVINVHYGPLPKVQPERPLFNQEGSAWSLHTSGENLLFQFFAIDSTHSKNFVRDIAIFKQDFSSCELFICPRNLLPVSNFQPPEKEKVALFPFAYPLDELLIINMLALHKGVHVHSLGVVNNDKALVFCGVSGAGKSTMAELWKKRNVKILSDDRISLRIQNGKIWAHGTPWHGDAKTHLADKAPLETIYFIVHGKENRIVPLSKPEIVTRLLVRCFPTFYLKQGMDNTLGFIGDLADIVPCFELQFTPDQRAVDEVLHHVESLTIRR
jgi:hypothetical protein